MKKVFFFIVVTLLFSNCTHRIVRTGYDVSSSNYDPCDVIIKKYTSIPDSIATKLGEIKLGESGFSVVCSEAHAINIMKDEACAIGADIIIITNEVRPDLWSSCYRCSASFYKYNSSTLVIVDKNNIVYNPDNIQKRVSQDRSRNIGIVIGSIVVTVVVLLLMN